MAKSLYTFAVTAMITVEADDEQSARSKLNSIHQDEDVQYGYGEDVGDVYIPPTEHAGATLVDVSVSMW